MARNRRLVERAFGALWAGIGWPLVAKAAVQLLGGGVGPVLAYFTDLPWWVYSTVGLGLLFLVPFGVRFLYWAARNYGGDSDGAGRSTKGDFSPIIEEGATAATAPEAFAFSGRAGGIKNSAIGPNAKVETTQGDKHEYNATVINFPPAQSIEPLPTITPYKERHRAYVRVRNNGPMDCFSIKVRYGAGVEVDLHWDRTHQTDIDIKNGGDESVLVFELEPRWNNRDPGSKFWSIPEKQAANRVGTDQAWFQIPHGGKYIVGTVGKPNKLVITVLRNRGEPLVEEVEFLIESHVTLQWPMTDKEGGMERATEMLAHQKRISEMFTKSTPESSTAQDDGAGPAPKAR